MVADTRIQTYAVNYGTCIQALHLGVSVKLVEETYAQCQIGVGKQLDCLGLGGTHKERIDFLLDGTFLQQTRKGMGSLLQTGNLFIESNDDSGRIEVVIESLALTQELGGEYDVGHNDLHRAVSQTLAVRELLAYALGIAYGNS